MKQRRTCEERQRREFLEALHCQGLDDRVAGLEHHSPASRPAPKAAPIGAAAATTAITV